LKSLLDEGIYARAAAMTDTRIMPREERQILIQMLDEIDPEANYINTLEEEIVDPYDTTIKRIKAYRSREYAKILQDEILRQRFRNTF